MSKFTSAVQRFFPAILLGCCIIPTGQTACAQSKPLVFLQAADPQMGMFSKDQNSQREIRNLSELVQEANQLHPAFVVICGDLTNSSTNAEELRAFRSTISGLHVPLHLVPGNHDVGNRPTPRQIARYRRRYGRDYYSFHSGSFIGIVLDSMLMGQDDAPRNTARQLAWLRRELRRDSHRKGAEIAVFQHIPFFVKSPDEPNSYWNIPLPQRTLYLNLLRQYGVTHVYAGHLHRPIQARGDGLTILIVGATGKPLGGSVSGFNLVAVTSGGTQWTHRYFPLTAMPTHLDPPW